MVGWLHQRLLEEDSSISPKHSLLGTAHWLRSLSLLCCSGGFSPPELVSFYGGRVNRRKIDRKADTLAFELMMMSFHQLSALSRISEQRDNPYDSTRSAIVAWYYGLYYAGGAMVAAKDGTHQDNHAGAARAWKSQIVDTNLVVLPFSLCISSLVRKEYEEEIMSLRSGQKNNIRIPPQDEQQALEGCLSHLKGSSDWYREKDESNILRDKEFKKLDVTSFRTKNAQVFRDTRLGKKSIGFLHQAYRYRGKAHYRDAIYLSYGEEEAEVILKMNQDLYATLSSFLRMASHYCARRVEKGAWAEFIDDVEVNSLLSHDVDVMRVK